MLAMAAQLGAMPAPRVHPLAKIGGWKAIGAAGLLVIAGGSVIPALRARSHVTMGSHATASAAQAQPIAPRASTATSDSPPAPPVAGFAPGTTTTPSASIAAPISPTVTRDESHPAVRSSPVLARNLSVRSYAAPAHDMARVAVATARPVGSASACPVAVHERVTVELEARVIASAMRSLASDPAVTLACVHELEAHGGPVVLRDEHWFLGFSASRRLGRDDDARRWANALLRGAPDSPYATRVTRFLDGVR
jgi:hypothetical protein